MSKKVLIVGGGMAYAMMFQQAGWDVVEDLLEADLVQFTGGADVSPSMYGQRRCVESHISSERDIRESVMFNKCIDANKPMAGVCRGGQFLNVMNNGTLMQDINNHAICGTHKAYCTVTDKEIDVSSTHHQMMMPGEGALVVAVAEETTYRKCWPKTKAQPLVINTPYKSHNKDYEVLYYEATRSLCYQPHPEIMAADSECRAHYFELISALLDLKVEK